MIRIALLVLLVASPALAQQQAPTLAEMRGALAASVAQLDAVRNLHIQAEAKATVLAEEVVKLRARVQELEKLSERKD